MIRSYSQTRSTQETSVIAEIPNTTNLQLEPDTTYVSNLFQMLTYWEIARKRFQKLLDVTYNSIVSKSATDIGRKPTQLNWTS